MVSPVVMYGCESWTVKKAECRRIAAFELWCWRRFLRVPWTGVYQASLSMGFSRQEYWSGLPFPSPWDLSDPAIKPRSPEWQADALPSEPPGKPIHMLTNWLILNSDLIPNAVPLYREWGVCVGVGGWENSASVCHHQSEGVVSTLKNQHTR